MVAMTNQILPPKPLLECPSCGRHTIVEYRTSVYRCIACDFERDLEEEDYHSRRNRRSKRNTNRYSQQEDDNDANPLPVLLIGGILVLLLI
ncbi:MAG: hypothetical protein F6K30_26310 [Cyanothece sp. SIO2G6]|nr:hypothetical protein [Cyanothece sp. SIO2G6]